jgi:hypothetical protein
MCTGVQIKKCPTCNRYGKDYSPYIERTTQTLRCKDSYVSAPATSEYPTLCHSVALAPNPTLVGDPPCRKCISEKIKNPKTEADLALKKQSDDIALTANNRKEEARQRIKDKAMAYKATDPAKQPAKRTSKKTPVKTKGAIEKTPRKTKTALKSHAIDAAEASTKRQNAG